MNLMDACSDCRAAMDADCSSVCIQPIDVQASAWPTWVLPAVSVAAGATVLGLVGLVIYSLAQAK